MLILPDALKVTRNAGQLASQGVGLQVHTTTAKGLEVTYKVGYTNAKYTR